MSDDWHGSRPIFESDVVQDEGSGTTPQPTPSSAIVKVLVVNVIYMGGIYNGLRRYSYPTPIVTGTSTIGRVERQGEEWRERKMKERSMLEGWVEVLIATPKAVTAKL